MVRVTRIECLVLQNGWENADTEGSVFLGIGGREYRLDSKLDDFERDKGEVVYVIGEGPADQNANPPQYPVLEPLINNLSPANGNYDFYSSLWPALPRYIRLEGNDHWGCCGATARVYAGQQLLFACSTPPGLVNITLGPKSGRVAHLVHTIYPPADAILAPRNTTININLG